VSLDGFELEHSCWNPKECEICLNKVKPEETMVEARNGSDVQIDRQVWAKRRKTDETLVEERLEVSVAGPVRWFSTVLGGDIIPLAGSHPQQPRLSTG